MSRSAISPFPDLEAKRRRFLRFATPARFGNLASTLSRAADMAGTPEGETIAFRMLCEAILFLSWTEEERGIFPAGIPLMKRELTRLRCSCESSPTWEPTLAAEVVVRCEEYSRQALEWSGLLDEPEDPQTLCS